MVKLTKKKKEATKHTGKIEKRKSQIMHKTGATEKEAGKQTSQEIESKQKAGEREAAQTPEAVAQRSLDIEEAKRKIKLETQPRVEETTEPIIPGKESKGLGFKGAVKAAVTGDLGPNVQGQVVPIAFAPGGGLGGAGTGGLTGGVLGEATVKLSRNAKLIIGGLAGSSSIMTWLASDNIIQGMNIFTRDIRQAATFGQVSPQEALARIDEAQKNVNVAKTFISVNTAVNPLLWPFRNLVLTNVEGAQLSIDQSVQLIENIGAAPEESSEEVERGS